jgi:hypothetical protein
MNPLGSYRNLTLDDDPFPHGVIDQWLPMDLARELAETFPPVAAFRAAGSQSDSAKLELGAYAALTSALVGSSWRQVISALLSREHVDALFALFGPSLASNYPGLKTKIERARNDRPGMRYRDGFDAHDLLVDAVLTLHRPNRDGAATDRGPHLKIEDKPIVGILMLRRQADNSRGGDLSLYRAPGPIAPGVGRYNVVSAPERLEHARRIPRANNRLVLFLNTPRSIQSWNSRPVTPHELIYLHFVLQFPEPLFAPRRSAVAVAARAAKRLLGQETGIRRRP